jgi:hypothetical protein
MSPHTGPRWSFATAENISRIGTQIKLSRFGSFSTQKLYTSHQNFVIYMRTILALDWPLLVYIACDILLGLFLYKYLFLKWQYSSIGPQIMTNFVKIGTKKSPQSGETNLQLRLTIDSWHFCTSIFFFLKPQNCRQNLVAAGRMPYSRFYL